MPGYIRDNTVVILDPLLLITGSNQLELDLTTFKERRPLISSQGRHTTRILLCIPTLAYLPPKNHNYLAPCRVYILTLKISCMPSFSSEHGKLEEHNHVIGSDIPIHLPIIQPLAAILEPIITMAFFFESCDSIDTTSSKILE